MQFIEEKHTGEVISRIVENALVEEPIIISIEGVKTELTLKDAIDLANGLLEAADKIKRHQTPISKREHCICIGKTKNGMSFLSIPSKLH